VRASAGDLGDAPNRRDRHCARGHAGRTAFFARGGRHGRRRDHGARARASEGRARRPRAHGVPQGSRSPRLERTPTPRR
jgi:hypothetical protein